MFDLPSLRWVGLSTEHQSQDVRDLRTALLRALLERRSLPLGTLDSSGVSIPPTLTAGLR
jgi:hypothetical protein